jgi:hypothetical protein
MMNINRSQQFELDDILNLFESKVREVVRIAGIKETNHLPDGFEFGYKGKKIEIKIKVK